MRERERRRADESTSWAPPTPRGDDEILDRSSRGRSWRIHKLVVVLAQYQVLLAAEYKVTK